MKQIWSSLSDAFIALGAKFQVLYNRFKLSLPYNIYRSIGESSIRFFDNLFQEDQLVQVLRLELERERQVSRRYADVIIEIASPVEIVKQEPETYKEIKPLGRVPWQVRAKQMQAMKNAERAKELTIDELENELGIVEN